MGYWINRIRMVRAMRRARKWRAPKYESPFVLPRLDCRDPEQSSKYPSTHKSDGCFYCIVQEDDTYYMKKTFKKGDYWALHRENYAKADSDEDRKYHLRRMLAEVTLDYPVLR